MIFWALIRKRWKRKAPIITIIYLGMQCMTVLLSYSDMLPDLFNNPDKKTDEVKILITIVYSHCLNYNTFRTTIFLHTLLVIPFGYAALKE